MKVLTKKVSALTVIISVILAVIIWFIVSLIVGAEIILPSPVQTFNELILSLKEEQLYISVLCTVLRAVLGFLLAYFFATLTAFLSYKSKIFERLVYPLIVVLRALPTMSVLLLLLIWFRSGFVPVFVSFIALYPLIYSSTLESFNSLNGKILDMLKVYEVPKKTVVKKYILPKIFNSNIGATLGYLSYSVKLTVSGEAIAQSSNSLGLLLYTQKAYFNTGRLFAYTLIAILITVLFEIIIKLVLKGVKYGR